jgi:hypothetical protein
MGFAWTTTSTTHCLSEFGLTSIGKRRGESRKKSRNNSNNSRAKALTLMPKKRTIGFRK